MRHLVEFRNKCAHGSLDIPFFDSVEPHLERTLKIILEITRFDDFTLWGKYGPKSVRLRGRLPHRVLNRRRKSAFWIESSLLSTGFTEKIPFLVYREDTQRVYCLNDSLKRNNSQCEFIDYGTGQVIYRQVDNNINLNKILSAIDARLLGLQPDPYKEFVPYLQKQLQWREIPLTKLSADAQSEEFGVYLFITSVKVYGRQINTVHYVGKGCLKERLESYIRIKKGYDDKRPEISRMFEKFDQNLKFVFTGTDPKAMKQMEWIVYQVLRPEFNLISPPKPEFEEE